MTDVKCSILALHSSSVLLLQLLLVAAAELVLLRALRNLELAAALVLLLDRRLLLVLERAADGLQRADHTAGLRRDALVLTVRRGAVRAEPVRVLEERRDRG